MSSQRAFFKIIFSAVALVLLLHISFSLISASPVEAKETAQSREDVRYEELLRQIDELTALVEENSNRDIHFMLLRIEQNVLGESVTLDNELLTVAVDPRFYDSCSKGDEVTNSPWIEHLSEPLVGEVRIFVADKYIVPQ